MTDLLPIRRALISVSDKTGIVPFAEARRSVRNQHGQVALLERLAHKAHHLLIQPGERPVDARGVHQYHLGVGPVHDSEDTVSRRLGHWSHNGHFGADQRVDQRALSGVGPADNRGKA